ncbi:MAG TPA: electron transfer flavoprotein-ubiquinone oxidoreductase [Rickettsiales bacterium]|nr:electron transfer flavoprotein-ubiquinone oxidoreductase [Rickettsiales bacterium]
MTARERMEFDVVIVGAGPAGLSAAIKLRQLAAHGGRDISVCVLEKGAEVGAHILAGAVLETRALDELMPDWKNRDHPLSTPVTKDEFRFLTEDHAWRMPTPPQMHNKGNYVVSLSDFCRWLGKEAEALGVQIFPGFTAADLLIEKGALAGVLTGEFGVAKDGSHKPSYQPAMEIRGRVTLLAEGCRGSLSERIMKQFALRKDCDPQTYAIGIKELWEIDPAKHRAGKVIHTVGWPLSHDTYGGSFIYHAAGNRIAIGLVTGLDYSNPYLDPFQEFQRFKTHPFVERLLEGGKRIAYGARALNEGGYQSVPGLAFPGGALIGCAAGFMNVPKVKGTHTAMKSAMCAAEAVFAHLAVNAPLADYEAKLKASWVFEELYKVRNIRPSFHKGLLRGLLYSALDTYLLGGKAPWTLHHKPDYSALKPAAQCKPIHYPKPDGVLTFDRMSSVYLSNTNHEENQPVHLWLKDASIPVGVNLPVYAEPAQRYCPAGVYEIVTEGDKTRLQINAQNCVHCKTCDIKDPERNIVWTPPEGGGGPVYSGM